MVALRAKALRLAPSREEGTLLRVLGERIVPTERRQSSAKVVYCRLAHPSRRPSGVKPRKACRSNRDHNTWSNEKDSVMPHLALVEESLLRKVKP